MQVNQFDTIQDFLGFWADPSPSNELEVVPTQDTGSIPLKAFVDNFRMVGHPEVRAEQRVVQEG